MKFRLLAPIFFLLAAVALPGQALGQDDLAGRLAALERRVAAAEQRIREIAPPSTEVPEVAAVAGRPVHVRLTDAQLAAPDVHRTRWRWDFGDTRGRHNAVEGFNAAHEYARPGAYPVTLNGRPFARVVVAADARPRVGVATEADLRRLKAGTIALLPAEIRVTAPLTLPDDVELRPAAESGTSRVVYAGVRQWTIFTAGKSDTFRRLRFAVEGAPPDGKLQLDAVSARDDTAVIGCEIEDLDILVNGNARPKRVYVADNATLADTSLRRYLAWGEGEDWAVYGNLVRNSRLEHGIRLGASGLADPGCVRIALCFNDLNNLDRRPAGDPHDTAKGDLTMQTGAYGYCYANTFRGPTSVGPLGEDDGLKNPRQRWRVATFAENRWAGAGWLHVKHGAEHVWLEANAGPNALKVDAFNAVFGRGVVDLGGQANRWPSVPAGLN